MDRKNIIAILAALLLAMIASNASAADCGGAIPCSCGDTVTSDYTMASDLGPCSSHGLIIGADDITLDCGGHSITGDGGTGNIGISFNSRTGVTIKNCRLSGFGYGIYSANSNSSTLTDIDASYNSQSGIRLSAGSSSNVLANITAGGNAQYGIFLDTSSNSNTLTGNNRNQCDRRSGIRAGIAEWQQGRR